MWDLVGNPEDQFSHDEAQLCSCTDWFVSDLDGNPEDRFCCDAAHLSTNSLHAVFFCSHIYDD